MPRKTSTRHPPEGIASDTIEIVDENLKHGFAQLPRPILRADGLSDKAKIVYALLLDYAWQQGSCFPGQERLAEDLHTTDRTIRRALDELKAYRLIAWKRRGLTQTNVYYILSLAANPNLSPGSPERTKMSVQDRTASSAQKRTPASHKEYSEETHTDQKSDDDEGVANFLRRFGISQNQVSRLVRGYPATLILEKLDLVSYLVERRSPLVARNPQGFLIKAIEEDYLPEKPKGYKTQAEREALALRRQQQEAAFEQARLEREQTLVAYKQQQQPKRIPGTKLTTATSWERTLTMLQGQMTVANFNMWLKQTVLVDCRDGQALIAAPSTFVAEWLQARMVPIVQRALVETLGQPVQLQFTVAPELTPPAE